MEPILEIENVCKSFRGVPVLTEVSLSVPRAAVTDVRVVGSSVIGPNGAGKTTLFNVICGLLRQDSGTIRYKGETIDAIRPAGRAALGIGRLWQDVRAFGNLTVMENLLASKKRQPGERILSLLFNYGGVRAAEREAVEAAERVLEFVRLEHKRHALARDLSYGQQKLLAVGRLLMNDAELFLLDELTAGLNAVMIENLLALLHRLADEGVTVLMIEHDIPKALSISHRVYVMSEGRVRLEGPPELVSGQLKEIYWGV